MARTKRIRLTVVLKCLVLLVFVKFTHYVLSHNDMDTQKNMKLNMKLGDSQRHETINIGNEKTKLLEDTANLACSSAGRLRNVSFTKTAQVINDRTQPGEIIRSIKTTLSVSTVLSQQVNDLQQKRTGNRLMIEHLQRQLFQTLSVVLSGFENVILTDIQLHENKGDSAITVGELRALHHLRKTLQASFVAFRDESVYAQTRNSSAPSITVVLAQGGGNIGAWPGFDKSRATVLKTFSRFRYIILPQSIYFFNQKDAEFARQTYHERENLTMILRDKASFQLAQEYFPKVDVLLAPDMAFAIGPIERFYPPTIDVIWINRGDKERTKRYNPVFPDHVTVEVTDWMDWLSPRSRSHIESCYMKTYNGLMFLQRGRVVVTDRLHGYILALLLNLPVIIIDNRIQKLSNLYRTWTPEAKNVRIVRSEEDAVQESLVMLQDVLVREAPGFEQVGLLRATEIHLLPEMIN